MTQRPSLPLKWHGGKHYLASQIIAQFPTHTHYVEPYFGGGAVLFAKPQTLIEGHSEVINDLDHELTNFWNVLQKETTFKPFVRVVQATPMSQAEWEHARDSLPFHTDLKSTVQRAINFFIRYRQSRQGLGEDFATLSRTRTRRGMNEQASSWLSAVDGLASAHARLQRVVILNDDAVKIIQKEDDPNTFFYCDPPYLHETRSATSAYTYEMSEAQHHKLLDTLGNLTGKFLLSGYPSPLYTLAEQRFGWTRTDIKIDNKASSSKTKPIKTECLWRNY